MKKICRTGGGLLSEEGWLGGKTYCGKKSGFNGELPRGGEGVLRGCPADKDRKEKSMGEARRRLSMGGGMEPWPLRKRKIKRDARS